MARPRKTATVDFTDAHDLTHGLLERATCPADVPFVLVRDAAKKGLRLRVTKAGGKHWQFETRIKGKLFTRALGEWPAVSIDQAKTEAHRLRGLTEQGIDPRAGERQQQAVQATADAALAVQAVTVGEVWIVYIAARKEHWGDRHYADHAAMVKAGGLPAKRGTRGRGVTVAGPLHALTSLLLRDLTAPVVEAWAAAEGKTRPTSARLAWRCLKAFLGWCVEQPQYAPALPNVNPAKTKKARESLGKPAVKAGSLEKSQLPAWFTAVGNLGNPVVSAYLQTLLLTGARPGEILGMKWGDVNLMWKGITIRDKVEGVRVIPLTPYVSHLLAALPKRNEWVFSSTRAVKMDERNIERRARRADAKGEEVPAGDVVEASATGHITVPRSSHNDVCKVAGLEGLTLHDLRRSFKSLTEWLEVPAGVVAQLMGHKPSATAEKHYTVRPLDLLRVHHEKIEAWILAQAGIVFDAKATPGALRVVGGVVGG
jgi:integrase